MLYSNLGFVEDPRQTSDLYDLPNLWHIVKELTDTLQTSLGCSKFLWQPSHLQYSDILSTKIACNDVKEYSQSQWHNKPLTHNAI